MDMTKLTKSRKAATRDFLVAYELRKKLARIDADDIMVDSTPEEDAAAREACARLVRPFDGDIAVGQHGKAQAAHSIRHREYDVGAGVAQGSVKIQYDKFHS